MSQVEVYAMGIVCCSVCADKTLTPEQVALAVNRTHPTGIKSSWEVSKDTHFASGHPNGCPCEDEPLARCHWLMEC